MIRGVVQHRIAGGSCIGTLVIGAGDRHGNVLRLAQVVSAVLLVVIGGLRPCLGGSIHDYCKNVVGESYSLMEACVREEETAQRNLEGRSVDPKIQSYCQNIASESYRLMEACVEKEEGAKRRIESRSVDSGIRSSCQRIVAESFSLMEACIEKEAGAKRRMEDDLPAPPRPLTPHRTDIEKGQIVAPPPRAASGQTRAQEKSAHVQGGEDDTCAADPRDVNDLSEDKIVSDEDRKLLRDVQKQDEICRGTSDEVLTPKACEERDKLVERLESRGFAYGREGQIGCQMRWHRTVR